VCELGMLADLSHASDRTFFDVAELADAAGKPVYASHSNARALCGHIRNLTDEQIRVVTASGGVVCVTLYAGFLRTAGECALADALAHIEHILSIGGRVGIGADFDGCSRLPEEIAGLQDMCRLYEGLLRANMPEELVRDIFYNNMAELVERVCVM